MPLAILQARTASCRMPGKAMAPVLGEPMIWRQLERIRLARSLSKVVVATSSSTADDALAGFLLGRGCSVYRGDPADVLGKLAACAEAYHAEPIVLLSTDSALTDPQAIDAAVSLALSTGAAYTANLAPRTYPHGLEIEVVTAAALASANREAKDPAEREDPTLFIRSRPDRFAQAHLANHADLSALRWTVERPEDFAFVRAVYQRLFPVDPAFGMDDVVELLAERPDLAALAAGAQAAAEAVEPAGLDAPLALARDAA